MLPIIHCANDKCTVPFLEDKKVPLPHLCPACRDELCNNLEHDFKAFDELPDDSPSDA